MAAANPILTPDRGKAHSVALAVLCLLVAAQVAAMVRAVWLVKANQSGHAAAAMTPAAAGSSAAPPLPSGAPAAPYRMTPPPVPPSLAGSAMPVVPSFSQPPPLRAAAAPIPRDVPTTPVLGSKPAAPPMDPELAELIEVAQQLRPLGDLKGALDVLRRAEMKWPDHPAVLAEFARTYELMGLGDKAAAAREKLAAPGGSVSSSYYSRPQTEGIGTSPPAPESVLSSATGLTTPDTSLPDPSKVLGVGRCEILRDRMSSRGEKVTLRVPIQCQPGAVIDPGAIDIDVFFFDLVNGTRVEQTKADAPVNTWVDSPVDWKAGLERLDVLYSMPEMTPEVVHNIGHRKFHGYIVKLYYQHKLQDTAMEPASLRDYGAASAPQTTGNPLLPPVTR